KSVPKESLDDPIDMFGQQATKRAGLILLVTHMHEHLGQMVAYARMNGVAPPWSAGG
ncbi:MAG: DinB family protein, partial [Gammaproteobacteria bacterium]|nr:DinB family protein [Gammaproteobacteria bacterium]